MTFQLLRYYGQLLREFRNGGSMIRALRGGAGCEVAVLRDGTRIAHPPGRAGLVELVVEIWLAQTYTRGGFYRPADGDVIVDVGANIGLFAIWIARRNPRCRVIALEPFPENFAYLEANLRAAGLGPDRVEAHRVALGRTFGTGRMIAATNRSLDHVLSCAGDAPDAPATPVIPLAGLFDLARADRVALLKVDIEGAEHDAFAEADPAVLGRCDRIAIEYHDCNRPGTLALLQDRLAPTHQTTVHPSGVEGCGVLLAARRAPTEAAAR